MNRLSVAGIRLIGVAVLLFSGAAGLGAAGAAEPKAVGSQMNFSLQDLDKKTHALQANDGTKVWVLVFISTECPIARSYIPTLNDLAEKWSADDLGVQFYGVISDPSVIQADAKAFFDEFAVKFPVLFDSSGKLASLLLPTNVPEAFVLDQPQRLLYRGRIDDVYAEVGTRRFKATQHNLRDAVSAVLAEEAPQVSRTKPVGCPFEAWKVRGKARSTKK